MKTIKPISQDKHIKRELFFFFLISVKTGDNLTRFRIFLSRLKKYFLRLTLNIPQVY